MSISIDNNSYIFLPLYRSVFFRFCKFEKKYKNKQDIIITNALNIKNRKERITYIYDATCDYIDDYYNHSDICGFKDLKCYANRSNGKDNNYGCCRFCYYKTNHGCPSKNLACKLFNCSEVCKRRKVLTYKDLKMLRLLSLRQRHVVKSDYFSLREDVLKDLYCYTMTFATIRVVFRLIRNYFKSKKRT